MLELLAQTQDAADVRIPLGWILTVIAGLGTTISVLGGVVFSILNNRISAQANIIRDQAISITKLQEEIRNMSGGCGAGGCYWSARRAILTPAGLPSVAVHSDA